jgi:hypothetical protein
LQLAKLDLELPCALLLTSSCLKSLRALCCEVTTPRLQITSASNRKMFRRTISGGLSGSFSATRITALRALGLAATSTALALSGLPTRRSRGCGRSAARKGSFVGAAIRIRLVTHEALDDPVFERVEADHHQAPPIFQHGHGLRQH